MYLEFSRLKLCFNWCQQVGMQSIQTDYEETAPVKPMPFGRLILYRRYALFLAVLVYSTRYRTPAVERDTVPVQLYKEYSSFCLVCRFF